MTTASIVAGTMRRPPRGARWAADAAVAAWRLLSRVFGPSTPMELPPIAQAAAVRSLAYEFLLSDPGFAADLFAAADRHELLHDVR
ncbi:MAG: hypothetical protein HS128_18240 [Ideonella sp.]|nr:hypothetical protein [Ideonella sp.]MCC7457678.1 hypothetical protein [Nitrospira sp.]